MSGLDRARAALRLRQGRGARHDAPEAPAETLALMRLGTAYFARLLNALPDAALVPRGAARVVAQIALQARETSWGIEGDSDEDDSAAAYLADIDTCSTLPPRALRHLFDHTAIHLNVVLRDLPGARWDADMRARAEARARSIWLGALALGNGRPADLPARFRNTLQEPK